MSRSTSCADAVTLGSAPVCSHQVAHVSSGVRDFQPLLLRPQGAEATHCATRGSGALSSYARELLCRARSANGPSRCSRQCSTLVAFEAKRTLTPDCEYTPSASENSTLARAQRPRPHLARQHHRRTIEAPQ